MSYVTFNELGVDLQEPLQWSLRQFDAACSGRRSKRKVATSDVILKTIASGWVGFLSLPLYGAGACLTSISASRSIVHFCPSDIARIGASQSLLGLRHVTSDETLNRELRNGVNYGCSLNISFGFADSGLDVDGGRARFTELDRRLDHMYWWTRAAELTDYEAGIDGFLFMSLNCSDCPEGITVREWLAVIAAERFLIVRYPNYDRVADPSMWGNGLGRFPKQTIDPERLHALPAIPVDQWGFSDEELASSVRTEAAWRSVLKRCVYVQRQVLLAFLRDPSNTPWLKTPC